MSAMTRSAMLAEYQSVAVHGGIAAADPQRLILMLLDGALERIAQGRGFMERGLIADKGRVLGRAMALIQELRACLDMAAGGQIASNLDALYDYCCRQILAANADNNLQALEMVSGLLQEIRSAWVQLPGMARQAVPAP
jgi:flagellar protein FliS